MKVEKVIYEAKFFDFEYQLYTMAIFSNFLYTYCHSMNTKVRGRVARAIPIQYDTLKNRRGGQPRVFKNRLPPRTPICSNFTPFTLRVHVQLKIKLNQKSQLTTIISITMFNQRDHHKLVRHRRHSQHKWKTNWPESHTYTYRLKYSSTRAFNCLT